MKDDKPRLNVKELRQKKNTEIISTEESLEDIEPYITNFDDLLAFIETAPIETVTKLLKQYNIEFDNNEE